MFCEKCGEMKPLKKSNTTARSKQSRCSGADDRNNVDQATEGAVTSVPATDRLPLAELILSRVKSRNDDAVWIVMDPKEFKELIRQLSI